MLALRALCDSDMQRVEEWLNKAHVKRWYEIPHMGVTIGDWLHEIANRHGTYSWITYLIVTWQGSPIGMCQHYRCEDSEDEDFGTMPRAGSYGIDYLIGEEEYVGKGLGKGLITLLVNEIFSFPDAERVTADIDRSNIASEKALLSCGFSLLDAEGSRYVIPRNPKEMCVE